MIRFCGLAIALTLVVPQDVDRAAHHEFVMRGAVDVLGNDERQRDGEAAESDHQRTPSRKAATTAASRKASRDRCAEWARSHIYIKVTTPGRTGDQVEVEALLQDRQLLLHKMSTSHWFPLSSRVFVAVAWFVDRARPLL